MYEVLIQHINTYLDKKLSEEEIMIIKDTFKPKKLRKHQYFLQEGEICKSAGFIVKGALKQYIVDETGKENILGLYLDNWWVGDRESFNENLPSPYYIDAFEETELLIVTKDEGLDKLEKQPFMIEFMRILIEKQALKLLKRVHSTKTYTAEQRLAELEKSYPEFLQRFPQHIIASYLGMTKETLSRIRANSLKK